MVPGRLAALACACALAVVSVASTARASALARPIDDRALALLAAETTAPTPHLGGEPRAEHGGGGGTTSAAIAALKSLAIPGWGQLSTGHRTQAAVFGALEFGTWVAYGTFERQGALRRDSYFQTALLFAGIDLKGKSESYRRFVGQYESSDIYNQFVVRREAAYFYPDSATRAQYYATYSIPAANAWSWTSFDDFLRYRAQRRDSEHAFQHAKYALGFAVVNRLTSALAALRQASSARRAAHHATLLDGAPGHPVASLGVDVSPGPGLVPDARLACVVRF